MIMETLFLWFAIKHFICDFPLQAFPWMYKNKGTYGHPGGVVHALIHFLGTFLVLGLIGIPMMVVLCCSIFDFIAHYHIDWAKMRLGAHYNLGPYTSEWFWILLGFDQLLHFLTYYAIIMYVQI